jgi:hypothetical protein
MRSRLGVVFLVVGVVLMVASLFADVIGVGDRTVFGPLQIRGTIVGAVITALGLLITLRKKAKED